MLAALAPAVGAIVATEVHNPRTLPATTLGILARAAAPRARVEVVPDPDQALAAALALAPMVVVAGSLFLVGELRPLIESRGGVPLP